MKKKLYRKFIIVQGKYLYPAFAYHKVLKYILLNPKCTSMHLTTTDILPNVYSGYCEFIGIFQYWEFGVNPLLFMKLECWRGEIFIKL